jgi:type II secretory pathway pseudopilin PulG
MKHNKRKSGFSLVEVVVSVGIFAVAIVGIIGLFAPTTKNVAAVADSDASTRAVAAIQSYLKEQASTSEGFKGLQSTVTATGTNYDYYATKGGDKVVHKDGKSADTIIPNSGRFFEFSLTRNTDLSKVDDDDAAGFLAFTIKLRWPAYLPDGSQVGNNKDDSSNPGNVQKTILIVPAAVTR